MVAGVREVQPGIAAVSGGTEGDRWLAAAGQLHARVINADGTIAGWQDKGQLDPSEESISPADGLPLADLDLTAATGLLAARCRTTPL